MQKPSPARDYQADMRSLLLDCGHGELQVCIVLALG